MFTDPRSTTARPHVVVAGAGLTGITTAALLARSDHRVTLLEADAAPPPTSAGAAWQHWVRPGVNQFRHPHLMLPRWYADLRRELPDFADALAGGGGEQVNLLHLQPGQAVGDWQDGDERFTTVTARRPVLEATLMRHLEQTTEVTVRRGAAVTGLLAEPAGASSPLHVRGVRTTAGPVPADLVIDASGRRTGFPRMLEVLGGRRPEEVREPCGFIYYSRYFRSSHAQPPSGHGSVLTHHPSWSVLTLPSDAGTYCVVLVVSSRDHELRALRHPDAWTEAALLSPVSRAWVAHGVPITPVLAIAGIEDIRRHYIRDDQPVATGLIPVGDSSSATNPSLGRGAAIGLIEACAIRDVLREHPRDRVETACRVAEAVRGTATTWVDLTCTFDRHRLAEMQCEAAGAAYRPDDPGWAMTTALLAGAQQDPRLARASGSIAGMLATPAQVFSDPSVAGLVTPYLGRARHAPGGPTRDQIVSVARGVTAGSGTARDVRPGRAIEAETSAPHQRSSS